jgi:hypothetical protein
MIRGMDEPTPVEAALLAIKVACGPSRPRPTEKNLPASVDGKTGVVNRMEAFWIETLHDAFRSVYPHLVVLSKARRDKEWHRSEFLHDITVLERAPVKSAYRERGLAVARHILWQVESELSGNGREVAIDFSKLIAGSAENKLMIVRRPMEWQEDGRKRVLRFLSDMAVALHGNLFVAFLPAYASRHQHLTEHWTREGPLRCDLVHLRDGKFEPLPNP